MSIPGNLGGDDDDDYDPGGEIDEMDLSPREWERLCNVVFRVTKRHRTNHGVDPFTNVNITPLSKRKEIMCKLNSYRNNSVAVPSDVMSGLKLQTKCLLKKLKVYHLVYPKKQSEAMSAPTDVDALYQQFIDYAARQSSMIDFNASSPDAVNNDAARVLADSSITAASEAGGRRIRNANLSQYASSIEHTLNYNRIFQHWVVENHISRAAVTRLLSNVSKFQAQIDHNNFPVDCRTLLSLDKFQSAEVHIMDESVMEQRGDSLGKKVRKKKFFAYFGAESVLMKDSPGLVFQQQHEDNIYIAAQLDDSFVSQDLLDYIDALRDERALLYNARSSDSEDSDPRCRNNVLRYSELYRIQAHKGVETCFWVDLHVDDIALYNNSTSPKATPIQMRVYGLGKRTDRRPVHIIPLERSKPSVIGFYHSHPPMDMEFFTKYLKWEFRRLHPATSPTDESYYIDPFTKKVVGRRKCCVRIRLVSADGDARHSMNNTKKSGYNSCERCHDWGEVSNHSSHIRLINCEARLRRDSEWPLYLNHHWYEKDNEFISTPEPYRKGLCPFDEEPRILNPLLDFAMDGMHNVGGGAAKRLFECLFRMFRRSKSDRKTTREAHAAKELADEFLSEWRRPGEFEREVRSIDSIGKWKMREAHEALLYHLVALLAIPDIRKGIGESACDAAMCLVVGLQLIYHMTHESPSERDIEEAEAQIKTFFFKFVHLYSKDCVSYKIHALTHLPNECKIRESHLGGFDCYPYESWLGKVKDGFVLTGKGIVKQFANNLAIHKQHILPTDRDGSLTTYLLDLNAVVQEMKIQGTMNLPATTVHHVDYRGEKVYCQGFTVTTKYPDNVLVLRDERKTEVGYRGNEHVHILIVTGFIEDAETKDLLVQGHVFENPRSGHYRFRNKLRHLDLGLLGIHEAKKRQLSLEKFAFDFLGAVIGKAFPYHLHLARSTDANPLGENCLSNQKWIFIRFMHTRNPQTLQ